MEEESHLYDRVGKWTELKLEIVKKYAQSFQGALKNNFKTIYVNGFCNSGEAISKNTSEKIDGSALGALKVVPPFYEYHFVDLEKDRVNHLRDFVDSDVNAHFHIGDTNEILPSKVFPKFHYDNFERIFCLLDPYKLTLNWEVVVAAGKSKITDVLINFPVLDINRNVLWNNNQNISDYNREKMNRFWGDDSWRDAVYKEEPDLFGTVTVKDEKSVQKILEAYSNRLKFVAGFAEVATPLPMKNSMNAVVYYLIFATQKPLAIKIINSIMKKYRS
ncbi:three-Cys-motif partner protein TcmP [Leptospira weilii]|uniref:three-Cys-motif partner protein TcmP n=1 Tax=Leptospira weilii TaxID=28184 RepID=UPI000774BECD|nr:three-Cys-motif partner protein TcmP [Leptospira weilii]